MTGPLVQDGDPHGPETERRYLVRDDLRDFVEVRHRRQPRRDACEETEGRVRVRLDARHAANTVLRSTVCRYADVALANPFAVARVNANAP